MADKNKLQIILEMLYKRKGMDEANTAAEKHAKLIKTVVGGAYKATAKTAEVAFAGIKRGIEGALKTAASLGVSAGAAMAGSVREFYVWNKEAARAWTMMDVGVAKFASIRKEISRLSPELGVAKSELGKGWYQALSAGVDQNELIPFLRTAAKVAVADGSTVESAIDGLTTVLNSYELKSSDAARVTDQMFNAVVAGKTTFSELASYIAQAAPAAAAMGVGIDQVLGALVSLTKQGVPTSRGLVQIRNILLELNSQLGEGWGKKMTFQQGLESLAKSAGYSAIKLEKIFGKENMTGVLALVGEKAAGASQDLANLRSQTGSLDAAFKKVDAETGHWPKLWQTIRALVGDVGESLDKNLRPIITYVTKKLLELRDSGGFTSFVSKLSSKVAEIIENLVAGVKTAVEIFSKASISGLISAAVTSLIDMALTLLAEGLRSLGTVMVALAKIFSAALAADFMKMDIPGRDELKSAQDAAKKKILSGKLTNEQLDSFGVPQELRSFEKSSLSAKDYIQAIKDFTSKLDLDQATNLATATKDTDIDAAITQAFERFAASKGRIQALGPRVVDNISEKTGIDVSALYEKNRLQTKELLRPQAEEDFISAKAEAAPAPTEATPAAVPVSQKAPAKKTTQRCAAMTEYGNRCTRTALPGRKYCRIHEYSKDTPQDFAAEQGNRGWSVSQKTYDKARSMQGSAPRGKKGEGSAEDSLKKAAGEIESLGTVSAETAMALLKKIEEQNQKLKDVAARSKQPGG